MQRSKPPELIRREGLAEVPVGREAEVFRDLLVAQFEKLGMDLHGALDRHLLESGRAMDQDGVEVVGPELPQGFLDRGADLGGIGGFDLADDEGVLADPAARASPRMAWLSK